jgi:hypothetical protein
MIYRLIETGKCCGMEKDVKKANVMKFARQLSPVQNMINQKQPKNVEYFKYLGSMITNDARWTREIKSRIAMAKATFNNKEALFTSKFELNLRKKLVKCYIWSTAFYGHEIWTLRKVDQK